MARPREFDPDAALLAAMEVFWRRGFVGTSVDDLVAATGVSRYGLYGEFGDKRGLFLAALRRYGEAVGEVWLARLRAPDAGVATIRAYLDGLVEVVLGDPDHRSCLVVNSIVELGASDPEARAHIQDNMARVRTAFGAALTAAVSRGELPEDCDVEAHASHLALCAQAVLLQARSGADPAVVRQFVDVALTTLR